MATCGLGRTLAVVVLDLLEALVVIAQGSVVPVGTAQEHPQVVVLELQVMGTFEHRRKHVAGGKVQAAVIAVGAEVQGRVRVGSRNAGTKGKRRVELPL